MKKQEFKIMRRGLGTSRTTLNVLTSESQGYQTEKRKSKKLKSFLKKNNEGELPQSGKGNRLPVTPGSSEGTKEVGPKEEHIKAHHNYISQNSANK